MDQRLDHQAWCPDVEVDAAKVAGVVRLGHSRWQSAHEPCHRQTHHGDALQPTDGQGQQTVSMGLSRLHRWAGVAPVLWERGARLSQRGLATTARRERWHTWRTTRRRIVVVRWATVLLPALDAEGPRPCPLRPRSGPAGCALSTPVQRVGARQHPSGVVP